MAGFVECFLSAVAATVVGGILSIPWIFVWWWVSLPSVNPLLPGHVTFWLTAICIALILLTDTASIIYFTLRLFESEHQ